MDALVELSDAGDGAGGKARGLARLAALGLPVPPALVLGPDAYARWRPNRTLAEADFRALGDALTRLGAPLAVRSSALDEDAEDRSAAGQYESVMGVRDLPSLVAAVERCFLAAESERVRAYRGGGEAQLALVLQREIRADRAGIGFSVDPVNGDQSDVLLEVVFGHGERVVSGVADPDRFRIARDGGRVRARIAAKPDEPPARRFARTLRDDEARRIAALVLEAEAGFRTPVDVEFCLTGREPWLLQCRPITTLARVAA
jgi:pyruvate,water dikinase